MKAELATQLKLLKLCLGFWQLISSVLELDCTVPLLSEMTVTQDV